MGPRRFPLGAAEQATQQPRAVRNGLLAHPAEPKGRKTIDWACSQGLERLQAGVPLPPAESTPGLQGCREARGQLEKEEGAGAGESRP